MTCRKLMMYPIYRKGSHPVNLYNFCIRVINWYCRC